MADQVADEDVFLAAAAKDCGMCWTTSHNEAAVRGWSVSQSRRYAMPVGHIRWQL